MNISVHLCGTAIAYDSLGGNKNKKVGYLSEIVQRPQGSLVNQQKRSIANAVEWIRLNAKEKPLIFVATSPGFTNVANERSILSTFTHNLRNGHNVSHYVWVRELTRLGYPHFHFVVSKNWFSDPVGLSLYWSGLFGMDAPNSIRLGSKPDSTGKRDFFIKDLAHCRYLTKYLGKGLSHQNQYLVEAGFPATTYRKTYRQFGISQEARKKSEPKIFTANYSFHQSDEMVLTTSGSYVQKPATCIGRSFTNEAGEIFNPHSYQWNQVNPLYPVFFGTQKRLKKQYELHLKSRLIAK